MKFVSSYLWYKQIPDDKLNLAFSQLPQIKNLFPYKVITALRVAELSSIHLGLSTPYSYCYFQTTPPTSAISKHR